MKVFNIENENEWGIKRNLKMLEKNEFYRVFDYNCSTGKAIFIVYDLYPGVQITFNDFDTPDIIESDSNNYGIIEISHCLHGRVECEFDDHKYTYIGENNFAICSTKYIPNNFSFPLNRYYGISIIMDLNKVSKSFKKVIGDLNIDLIDIVHRLELDKSWYINKANYKIEHILKEIYALKNEKETGYFKIKVVELLYFINKLSIENRAEFKYYSGSVIRKIKQMRDFLIDNLDDKIKLEELSQKYNMSLTMFQRVFKRIYGDTPYAYIKKYRMNKAALLMCSTEKNINTIAMEVGYSNASKFSNAFKDVYGILPKDYRKESTIMEHY